jgi:hypothetical protein
MHRLGLIVLLVCALLATVLTVPAARAAKALGTPAGGQEHALAGPAARHAIPAKVCLHGVGLLGCAFFQPAMIAAPLPVALAIAMPPHGADRFPEGWPVRTPLRPPRLSA